MRDGLRTRLRLLLKGKWGVRAEGCLGDEQGQAGGNKDKWGNRGMAEERRPPKKGEWPERERKKAGAKRPGGGGGGEKRRG